MTVTAATIFLAVLYVVQSFPLTCNNSTQFDCQTSDAHRCIPLEWLCDGLKDCTNGLDESHCSYLHTCPEGDFICRSGDCVSSHYKCDGEVDCPGGEDENGCEFFSAYEPASSVVHTACHANMFQCRHGPCIAKAYICDGEMDCPLGEDERNCTKPGESPSQRSEPPVECNNPGMVMCADHTACFPKHWICDGEADCLDESDESDCALSVDKFLAESVTELCHPGEHRCDGGSRCIPMNRTCDGKLDCPDGDDEGPLCKECEVRRTPCEYKCVNTPLGFCSEWRGGYARTKSSAKRGRSTLWVKRIVFGSRCVCPHGSSLNPDEYTCTQKDECSTPEGKQCQHYCENRLNSYRCTCAPGYRLGPDGHSCRLDRDNEGTLFVALGHEVRTMPLFESRTSHEGYETAQSLGSHGVVRSIDFVVNRQLIYLAISGSDHRGEVAVSVGGLLRVVRENIIGVGQIAVDWMGNNFFLTQRYPSLSPGISVCTQDGFFCRKIVKGQVADMNDPSKRQHYQGIALHPQRGAMVWIESYANRNRIMSANMDGTNVRVLVENKLEYPTGIAIDMITSDVYFGDVEREMIERVNLDTRERTVVLTQGVHHPYDLKYFNGFLYWSDWGSSSLKVAELSIHHSSAHLIHSFTALPFGLAINHSMYQPSPSSFPCQFTSCQWMCVSIPNAEGDLQAKCLCPDGYVDKQDGDCAPLRESVVEDVEGITDEDIHKTVVLDLSHVGVAWMKERCDNGDGCLNGGECQDIKNEHGRVTKIVCNCPAMYEGDRCERKNPFEEESSQFMPSSRSMFFPLLFTAVFILFIGAAFMLSYRYIDQIGKASKTVTNLVERRAKRIPPILPKILPFIHSIRDRFFTTVTGARNLHRKGSGVLRKDFSNPLFNDDRSSTGSAPEEAPTNELAYSNPIFADENTHAAPFSGIQVTYTNKFAT
ncbi:hypothetical protein V3C99_002602 [Haemonchus contortus]